MAARYDDIGKGYDTTRKADPKILAALNSYLEVQGENKYLDVACGTGNYTMALSRIGGQWHAFDYSEKMLAEAKSKSNLIKWAQFDVGNIGYESNYFNGAICSLAIHHFPDLAEAFSEIARVLKPQAELIIFTATPEQMHSYWLTHYFPKMMEMSCEQMPTLEEINSALLPNGLSIESTQPFFITPELQDFFLYSGKQRPDMYLSEVVRRGISSFHNFCTKSELQTGLSKLRRHIESGAIFGVMNDYQSDIGDYLFVCAAKS